MLKQPEITTRRYNGHAHYYPDFSNISAVSSFDYCDRAVARSRLFAPPQRPLGPANVCPRSHTRTTPSRSRERGTPDQKSFDEPCSGAGGQEQTAAWPCSSCARRHRRGGLAASMRYRWRTLRRLPRRRALSTSQCHLLVDAKIKLLPAHACQRWCVGRGDVFVGS